jgi:hypothetical protein
MFFRNRFGLETPIKRYIWQGALKIRQVYRGSKQALSKGEMNLRNVREKDGYAGVWNKAKRRFDGVWETNLRQPNTTSQSRDLPVRGLKSSLSLKVKHLNSFFVSDRGVFRRL